MVRNLLRRGENKVTRHPPGPEVSAQKIPEVTPPLAESAHRYNIWLEHLREAKLLEHEFLLPQIHVPVPKTLPALMARGKARESLEVDVKALAPWGYSIQLAPGILTGNEAELERMIFRSHLLSGAITEGLRLCDRAPTDMTAVDFACNHGYFTMLAAELGFKSSVGFDLREINLRKAQLMSEQFDHPAAKFELRDVYTFDGKADLVMNLGLLYHVTDPVRLLELSFKACGAFCILDTITHSSPVSAFILRTNKNKAHHAEGAYSSELHPTYRAVIDLMHAAGFVDLIEILPEQATGRAMHPLYDTMQRRCLIGFLPGARKH